MNNNYDIIIYSYSYYSSWIQHQQWWMSVTHNNFYHHHHPFSIDIDDTDADNNCSCRYQYDHIFILIIFIMMTTSSSWMRDRDSEIITHYQLFMYHDRYIVQWCRLHILLLFPHIISMSDIIMVIIVITVPSYALHNDRNNTVIYPSIIHTPIHGKMNIVEKIRFFLDIFRLYFGLFGIITRHI
jgi:hypothetical protein